MEAKQTIAEDILSQVSQRITAKDMQEYQSKWLIDRFLRSESLVMIYGSAGSGKSIFGISLATFLLENRQIDEVLYLDADNGKATMKERRLDMILSKCDTFKYYFIDSNERFCIFEKLKIATDLANKLIVIDSIRNFMNIDFTKDKEVTIFLSQLQVLRNKGATIIFLHHQPKQIEGENNKIYKGSTAFIDSVDEAYYLCGTKDIQSIVFQLEPQKFRDNTESKAFVVETDNFTLSPTEYLLLGLNEKQQITFQLAAQIITQHKEGITQTQLAKAIQSQAQANYLEIVGKNTLWKLLNRFNGIFFEITRQSHLYNKKIYKPLENSDYQKLILAEF